MNHKYLLKVDHSKNPHPHTQNSIQTLPPSYLYWLEPWVMQTVNAMIHNTSARVVDDSTGCLLSCMDALMIVLEGLSFIQAFRRSVALGHLHTAPSWDLRRPYPRPVQRPEVNPGLSNGMVDPYRPRTDLGK